jgi:hypothetical protein
MTDDEAPVKATDDSTAMTVRVWHLLLSRCKLSTAQRLHLLVGTVLLHVYGIATIDCYSSMIAAVGDADEITHGLRIARNMLLCADFSTGKPYQQGFKVLQQINSPLLVSHPGSWRLLATCAVVKAVWAAQENASTAAPPAGILSDEGVMPCN